MYDICRFRFVEEGPTVYGVRGFGVKSFTQAALE
jgi:hypothetical protein